MPSGSRGPHFQGRINAALREYMNAWKRDTGKTSDNVLSEASS
jgi:hypothetical protein